MSDKYYVHENRNSFKTGELENSGFSSMQLAHAVSKYNPTKSGVSKLTSRSTADQPFSSLETWAGTWRLRFLGGEWVQPLQNSGMS